METDLRKLSHYLSENAQVIDYCVLASQKPILFLAETHKKNPIRIEIAGSAKFFKQSGFTHYGIEASFHGQPALDRLMTTQIVDFSGILLGPDGGDSYELAVRAVAAQGIKVRALDIEDGGTKEVETRENHMYQEVSKIFKEDKFAKMAILIGALHARRTGFCIFLNTKPLGTRLLESGVDSLIARYICADNSDSAPGFQKIVREVGLQNSPFMIRLQTLQQFINLGVDTSDFVIYLPKYKTD